MMVRIRKVVGLLVGIIGLSLVGLSLCGCDVLELLSPPTPTPTPMPVREGGAERISAEGVVIPVKQANLSFEIGGRIDALLVEVGDTVEAGQVIARLDSTDWQQRLREADAALEIAHAELVRLEEAGAREEEIAVAQARVNQAFRVFEGARIALRKTALQAPFAGTVGQIMVEKGEVLAAGQPVAIIGDLTDLRVRTDDLSEVDIDRVTIGRAVRVEVDALPDTELHGRVVEIAPMATRQHGDIVYTVTIDLEEGLEVGLRWGMTAYIEIIVSDTE